MNKNPWVRFFPSDWLGGTRGMTAAETGIYITLIMTMYEHGKPLNEDHSRLARLCGASNSVFKSTLETLIDQGKIQRVEDGVWNDRVGRELFYVSEKSSVGREAANARWNKKDNKNNGKIDANALQTQSECNANQKPDTRYIKKDTNVSQKKGCRLPEDFQPDYSIAITEGFTQQQAQRLFENFKDFWNAKTGKDATKLDWLATWRNWVRNPYSQKFKGNNHANGKKSTARSFTEAAFAKCRAENMDPFKSIDEQRNATKIQSWDETDPFADNYDQKQIASSQRLALVANNCR